MSGAFCGAYDILPEAVICNEEFNDAVMLLSRADGRILASRAPFDIFIPGRRLCHYIPGLVEICNADGFARAFETAADEPVFGFRTLPTGRLSRISEYYGVGDLIYLRLVPDIPDVVLAVVPLLMPEDEEIPEEFLDIDDDDFEDDEPDDADDTVAEDEEAADDESAPYDDFLDGYAEEEEEDILPEIPTTLARFDELLTSAAHMGDENADVQFFSGVASLISGIADAIGAGVTFTEKCGVFAFGSLPGFDTSGLFVLACMSCMVYRRAGDLFGFDATVKMPSEDGSGQPYFVFSARMHHRMIRRDLPELAAMERIAAARGMTLEYCRRRTTHGTMLYVFFTSRIGDAGTLGLKAVLPMCGDEESMWSYIEDEFDTAERIY